MMKKPFPCPSFQTQTYERLLEKEPDTRTAPNCKHHPDTNLWTCFSKSRSWWTTSCGRIIRPEHNLGFGSSQLAELDRLNAKPVHICWPGHYKLDEQIQWEVGKKIKPTPAPAFGLAKEEETLGELYLTSEEKLSFTLPPSARTSGSKNIPKDLGPQSRYTMPNDLFRELCALIALDLEEEIATNRSRAKIGQPSKGLPVWVAPFLQERVRAHYKQMSLPVEIDMDEASRVGSKPPKVDRVDTKDGLGDNGCWDGFDADPGVSWDFLKQNLPDATTELEDILEPFPVDVADILKLMIEDNQTMMQVAQSKKLSLYEVHKALGIAADLVVEMRKVA